MQIERIESFFIGSAYVVRLTTDTGLSGIGQTACWGYPEAVGQIVAAFERYLIGQDPMRIEHHWQHLYRMSAFRGAALAGAISADDPESMVVAARDAVEEGFTALKFDPVHHIDTGIDRMVKIAVDLTAAAREGGGPDLDLIIEVHRKLTPMTALTLCEALAPFNLFFLEDPIQIDSIQAQADMARRTQVPIGNGERLTTIWEFRELLEGGGPQYVRPDVGMAGGLTHCKKIAAIAESYHSAVVTHNFLGPLITAASIHLDATIPNFITQEYTKADESEANAVYRCAHARDGGYIPLTEAPGLGVELVDELIESRPFVPMNTGSTPLREDGSVAYAV